MFHQHVFVIVLWGILMTPLTLNSIINISLYIEFGSVYLQGETNYAILDCNCFQLRFQCVDNKIAQYHTS